MLMAVVAALNYLVDPGAIYIHASADSRPFVEALVRSPYGLWWPDNSFQDRQIKKALSQTAHGECIVIGSSRAMQMGSARTDRLFGDICGSIVNLAVSSGGIEDDITLTHMAVEGGHPRKVILSIDPWTFAFGLNSRWSYYASDYEAAARDIGIVAVAPVSADAGADALANKLRNLFSLEYTMRSVLQLAADVRFGAGRFAARQAFAVDPLIGGPYPVLLPDGSLIYSAAYIAAASGPYASDRIEPFSKAEAFHDPRAIAALQALLVWLKSRGTEPILLLAPFRSSNPPPQGGRNAQAIVSAEAIARRLGSQLRIRIIGTYDARAAHCAPSQFYDYMHANTPCLALLR